MYKASSSSGNLNFDKLPDKCPFCHNSITPNIIFGYKFNNEVEIFMSCPHRKCFKAFISYYHYDGSQTWKYSYKTTVGKELGKEFNKSIIEISPSFELIYNEAYSAEQRNLKEICGVGYRKALEFLIKDYVILNNEEEKEKIMKMQLANCIKTYVNNDKIKTVAKRAVWLGNDETHYVRKWEKKNLQDLKKLIELTVHWIEMEKLTESFEAEMPE